MTLKILDSGKIQQLASRTDALTMVIFSPIVSELASSVNTLMAQVSTNTRRPNTVEDAYNFN